MPVDQGLHGIHDQLHVRQVLAALIEPDRRLELEAGRGQLLGHALILTLREVVEVPLYFLQDTPHRFRNWFADEPTVGDLPDGP